VEAPVDGVACKHQFVWLFAPETEKHRMPPRVFRHSPSPLSDLVQRCTFADSWSVFGSQARLFTRECAAWLMPLCTLGAEHHDQQTARLVALRWPLYYHAPSLVQYTGRVSTWGGGGFHTATILWKIGRLGNGSLRHTAVP
jgi:hypothetical protein